MRTKLRWGINVILIVIFVWSVSKIGYQLYEYYKDEQTYESIAELKPVLEMNAESSVNEKQLKEKNSEYKFWINVPGTVIDYPVVQAKDNDEYLNKDFNGNKSRSGTIFVDYRNNIDNDKNLIVYGHNMKNGSMFANITKFKNEADFKDGTIKIIKDNEEQKYEVFSVFIENEDYGGLKNTFSSEENYKEYIEELKNKSIWKKDVKNSDFENIITLFTCSYEFDGARTIVVATRVQ